MSCSDHQTQKHSSHISMAQTLTQLQADIAVILSNLHNARNVWGEGSEQHKVCRKLANDFLSQLQTKDPKPSHGYDDPLRKAESGPSQGTQPEHELVQALEVLALASSGSPSKASGNVSSGSEV